MEDRSSGGQFPGDAAGSSSWEGFPESPPLPFPRRLPDFSPNFSREDQFAFTNNEGFSRNNESFPRNNEGLMRNNEGHLRNDEGSTATRNDVKTCLVVSTAFSFFVSMCMAFGLYGSETLKLGPNTSALINPNHLFVESIQVAELDAAKEARLYGFYKTPPLDVVASWSAAHKITLPSNFHKEWIYYLNTGSQISINFTIDFSSSLVLAIVEGDEGLAKWLDDPSNPKTAVSWNIIYGNGSILKGISKSSSYYIAVGNLNTEVVKMNTRVKLNDFEITYLSENLQVDLNTHIRAFLYNTTEPYSSCTPADGECNFKLLFLGGNAAVLTTPGPLPGMFSGDWHVRLSYGPRWITYLLGTGAMITLLGIVNYILNHCQWTGPRRRRDQVGDTSERNPLISHETDDKHLSRSSSFASVSEGEGYVEDAKAAVGKPVKDEEDSRRLCAICFDDPKDCFFLPCGHCVSCFGCASRILEASGSCPICRRQIKKVRKIITV